MHSQATQILNFQLTSLVLQCNGCHNSVSNFQLFFLYYRLIDTYKFIHVAVELVKLLVTNNRIVLTTLIKASLVLHAQFNASLNNTSIQHLIKSYGINQDHASTMYIMIQTHFMNQVNYRLTVLLNAFFIWF